MRATLPLLLLTLAAPADAQIWDGGRSAIRETPAPPATIEHDLHDIDRAIRDGRRSGDLTRAEARTLRAQSAILDRQARQYRQGGPIATNGAALTQQALILREQVAAARSRPR
ncbi:hypothetical protein ACFQ15_08220 [Sphingomonas hankookensis]|uniref:hypothetical protein n=1 Tax=Sphingomonas hankookensis TaxID=563996 RepID=UPI001F59ACF3|nr:hypothetical protein [Sphingomonas hankookensis]